MLNNSVDSWAWSSTTETFGTNARVDTPKSQGLTKLRKSRALGQHPPASFQHYCSKFQLGTVITQNNRPLAFFSRKLSLMQQKYSVTEEELLAIVETLKGSKACFGTTHTDTLGLTSDRVYRWRLLLEEYAAAIVYIKGIHNTVADAIS
eukprot:CCRYP_020019-RA/>CCRYP_020019-RA protein AED:0.46 eAED:0.53 QI:0/0/0/1/0/0/4/0/148